jgi:hypothetical protein
MSPDATFPVRWTGPNQKPPKTGKVSRRRDGHPQSAIRNPQPVPPAGRGREGNIPITQPQRQRLFAIFRKAGREETEVRAFLKERYGLVSTKDILMRDYDAISAMLAAPGPLTPKADRDPGEEG